MKISRVAVAATLLLLGSVACAHEFWLEPIKFLLAPGEKARIDLMVGEDYTGEHSDANRLKLNKLDHYSLAGKENILSSIASDSPDHLSFSFSGSGNHLIALGNDGKVMELEAKKFNDYLRSEGLDRTMAIRVQRGDTMKPGREHFRRCAKTLVQVGGKSDQTYAINTGLRLEIIPQQNPYTVKTGRQVSFKILFDNKPLRGSLVLAWHAVDGKTTHSTIRSNKAGMVTFPINRTGKWMISTVHMIEAADPVQSDWESYWGSYTFGYF